MDEYNEVKKEVIEGVMGEVGKEVHESQDDVINTKAPNAWPKVCVEEGSMYVCVCICVWVCVVVWVLCSIFLYAWMFFHVTVKPLSRKDMILILYKIIITTTHLRYNHRTPQPPKTTPQQPHFTHYSHHHHRIAWSCTV